MSANSEDRLGTVIVAVGLIMSTVAMLLLVSTDIAFTQRLRASRILGTMVPASGSLVGRYADGSEWTPPDRKEHMVVLFGLAKTGLTGDVEFWRDVAARSRQEASDIQFVGPMHCGGGLQPDGRRRSTDDSQVHGSCSNARAINSCPSGHGVSSIVALRCRGCSRWSKTGRLLRGRS